MGQGEERFRPLIDPAWRYRARLVKPERCQEVAFYAGQRDGGWTSNVLQAPG